MDAKSLIILKLFCALILYCTIFVEGDIPYGMCADPTCSVPVSKGTVILRYNSPDDSRISVEPNDAVEIYVKDFGPKKDLWGITVRGTKGYVSKQFIRETSAMHKNLVPAVHEFKTSHLISSSYTTTSHLHMPSQQELDKMMNNAPEAFIHTQTVLQQDVVSSLPSGFQSQLNKPSEHLQGSHSSHQFKPSDTVQFDLNSRFGESSYLFDVPDHSSHLNFDYEDILSPSHVMGIRSENILLSQSNTPDIKFMASSESHLNEIRNAPSEQSFKLADFPSGSVIYKQDFQSQQPSIVPQKHFQPSQSMQQQQFQPSSSMQQQQLHPSPSMQQQQFQPSPSMQQQHSQSALTMQQQHTQPPLSLQQHTQSPPIMQQHTQSPPIMQQHTQSPPIMQQHNFQQSSDTQHLQRSSQVHPQRYPSQRVQKMLSSMLQDDFDDEYSRTFAMLQSYGLDDNDIFDTLSQPQLHQSSQNINPELGSFPSRSQYSPIESSDTLLYSSSNIDFSHNQHNKVPASKTLIENKDTINLQVKENLKNDDLRDDSSVMDEMDFDIDKELDIKVDEDDDLDSEIDDSEEEVYTPIDLIYSDSTENKKTGEILMESSMDSTKQETKSQSPQASSTLHNSHSDSSSLSEKISKVKESIHLSKESVSSYDSVHRESKVSEKNDIYIETQNSVDTSREINLNSTTSVNSSPDVIIKPTIVDQNSLNFDATLYQEVKIKNDMHEKDFVSTSIDTNTIQALQTEDSILKENVPLINEFSGNDQKPELNKLLSNLDANGIEDLKTTYQVRNLKGESVTTEESLQNSDSPDENITQSEFEFYRSFENGLDALKSVIDSFISWMPDPLHSLIIDLQNKGISPRVPVFTAICGFTIIFLIVPLIYIKEYSKEAKLTNQLAKVEKDAFHFSATNAALEEKIGSLQSEIASMETSLEEEKTASENLRTEYDRQKEELNSIKAEFETCFEECESLKKKEYEYHNLLKDHDKDKGELIEQKNSLEKLVKENEDTIANLMDQLQESENSIKDLEKEKIQYLQLKENYEEKLAQFESNCNQLLEEAEVWNLRVNELTVKVDEEKVLKEEVELSLKEKDEEIESLKQLVETFKSFEEIEDPEDQAKTKEEKLDVLMKSSMILSQLKKQEEETQLLTEQLEKEKNKILDMEVSVELLEAKSEIDKLKISYNQALQDKAEAQTKLDVLTNYFKDKEIQLQKQLGAQEAVRQKKEEDASSAERRIILIEQENASYKYQVASMKQEMEETERNLKTQISVQEKKAHENWIAARAAERKLEDMKQEVTQLRQRLTLLEREQENWTNASRDEIIRPVPKRLNDESVNQDLNTTERNMFPPMPLDRMLPHPMVLPPDRPLPPLPPPPPMFMPPMERHFRPQPWHLPPPDHSSDFRLTPPDFPPGRESTPPRGRPYPMNDRDAGPHASSPLTTETRDSRNSTPPYLLPDFHDVPPQPGRPPFFPPHLGHPRLPMHPPYRRDQGSKRTDNTNEYSSRGPQQPSSQEQWQHSRV